MLPKWYRLARKPGYIDKKAVWKERLSVAYLICSVSFFVLITHAGLVGKLDWVDYFGLKTEEEQKETTVQFWKRHLKTQDAKHYRIKGFSIEEITDEEEKEKMRSRAN